MSHNSKKSVIFVDDEEIAHLLARIFIDSLEKGYKTLSAYNYAQAENLINEHKNDCLLVISDLILPDQEGINLYHHLKAERSFNEVGFILQTGVDYNPSDHNVQDIDNEVIILKKPYSKQEFCSAFTRALSFEKGHNVYYL